MSHFITSNIEEEAAPPPPYSVEVPPSHASAHEDTPIYSQQQRTSSSGSYRTPVSPLTPRYASQLPTGSPLSPTNSLSELERAGFVSALPYFELRSCSRSRPGDTNFQHLFVDSQTGVHNLPFPEPKTLWHSRDVDEQDWTTFLNHLFPMHNPAHEDEYGRIGESSGKAREQIPLLRNLSLSRSSRPLNGDDSALRQVRVDAVVAQWNFGFFGPRGLGVTVQYINPPTSSARRVSGNSFQRHQPDGNGEETMLHQAVTKSSKSKTKEALLRGDYVDALNRKGETPLFRAVSKGEKAIVELLLDAGANPTSRPPGEYTPLQFAASRNRKGIVELLVEKCSARELDEVTPAGETALYLAVQKNHSGCFQALLKHNANINAHPNAGESIINMAVSNSNTSMIKLLLERGGLYLEDRNKNGDTPLGIAVARGDTKIVALLLDHGSSVVSRTGKGESPLSIAVSKGNTSIVGLLLARKEIDLETPNLKGETPLYKAITNGHTTITQLLLAKGANPDACPPGSDSLLNIAVASGNTALVQLLLNLRPDLEIRSQAGYTPLCKAVSSGNTAITSILTTHGANPNTTCSKGETVLWKSVSSGNTSIVSILLARGANPNTPHPTEGAPLYRAVSQGETAIVSLLLAAKAQPDAVGKKEGETALGKAVSNSNVAMVSLLCSFGAKAGDREMAIAEKRGDVTVTNLLNACSARNRASRPKC